ncbi:hypothetical protein ACEWY4_010459 [Coilia grayii]|uniref:Integrase catalytic domain-containing protein n=1 Tax=Coilia grayii TaxID=363190 RepID=A0ABD1K1Z1_9TELE
MLKRVRDVRGVRPCYRNDVANFMRDVDASGVASRYPGQKKIHRRNYHSHGPNDTWHIDGNDKLKFFGMWIHLCIDGFSRRLLWLKVGTSNRKQKFVARYFYDTVVKEGGCPKMIRSDRGKENLVVGQMQIAFQVRQLGEQAWQAFRMGTSVRNQRAESFNSMLKRTWTKKWLTRFEGMIEADLLKLDNPVHINWLQYTHLRLLQEELDLEQRLWNTHDIRKQHHAPGPFGKPDVLYITPLPGFVNMLCQVEPDLLHYASHFICDMDEQLLVSNEEFRCLCGTILEGFWFPHTVNGCLAAYMKLVDELMMWMNRNGAQTPSTFAEANELYKTMLRERE